MNNEIASREEVKRELIIEYAVKGLDYCVKHPIIVCGICISGIVMTTCIMIENKKEDVNYEK